MQWLTASRLEQILRQLVMMFKTIKEDDIKNGLSTLKRMGNVCKEAMNCANPDLQFTIETEKGFANQRVQTLDFEFCVEKGLVHHFEKSMRTPLLTMARSAMGKQQKHSILAMT